MTAEYRIYLGDRQAGDEDLEQLREVRVDQAAGMAAEAELEIAVDTDEGGVWSGIGAAANQPFRRVRVEVRPDGGDDFVPLIDGPIVAQRFLLTPAAGDSRMTLVVHDDSVLLNLEERVELFQEMSVADIARRLFSDAGLTPDVDAATGPAADPEQVVVQRGTAMQLLRSLARRYGMYVQVRPGAAPGDSIGQLKRPDLETVTAPSLRLLGEGRNIDRFEGRFDGLRPTRAVARGITLADRREQEERASGADGTPLGDRPSHDLVEPGETLLRGVPDGDADLEAAVRAEADASSWAYSAEVELDGDDYGAVLTPYAVVVVAGTGGHLGGRYLVSRVLHTITGRGYRQQVSLRRNARSDADGGGLFSDAVAAAGGVF